MSKARQLADNGAASPNRNMVINGAMNVAQRSVSVTGLGTADGYFTLDRFLVNINATSAGRFTMTQTADGPSGFANCLKLDCTTADTSIAASEQLTIDHRIEGQNLQRFKKGTADAEQFAVSFYVKGNASATYACELFDSDNTRQITKLFSVTTSWNRIELIFPADTTGAFDDDNAVSLNIIIGLHSGSTYTGGTLNSTAWGAMSDNATRRAGISSFFDSTNRTFFMTGLQLEVGSSATPFEHKTFAQDLEECQRYLSMEKTASGGSYKRYAHGGATGVNSASLEVTLSTPMRALPALVLSGNVNTFVGFSAGVTDALTALIVASDSNAGTFNRAIEITPTVSSGFVAGEQVSILSNNSATTFMSFDAEL